MQSSLQADTLCRRIGLSLLILPILFNLVLLAPELLIGTQPVNDHLLHQASAQRAAEALAAGENPLDAWVSEFSLGYPLWRSYPPLPHLLTGFLSILARPVADPGTVFLVLHYFLLSLLPAAFFFLARELELGWIPAGAAAALSITISSGGQFGRFGVGYGAQVWRGSGLYTQLWGIALALLAIALFLRLLRTGKGRIVAPFLIGCACLSHFVAGFFVVLSVALLTVFRRGETPAASRVFRLLTASGIVLAMTLFFVVPMALERPFINHSRWEDSWKWDSFGARTILDALANGSLFDEGRAPILTALLAIGIAISLWRTATGRARLEVTILATFWLLVFFGRDTWGHLLRLLAIPEDMHLHRFQMAFEVFALLLAAIALAAAIQWFRPWENRHNLLWSISALVALLAPLYWDRARYLQLNAQWGLENLWARQSEAPALQPILTELDRLARSASGRVHAGKSATWGGTFKVGSTPMHGVIAQRRLPGTSFLYHSMSVASETQVLLDDNSSADLALFGIRFVIAPNTWAVPPNIRFVTGAGRFRLYEVPGGGLFDVIDIPYAFEGERNNLFEPSRDWLRNPLRAHGQYVAIYPGAAPTSIYRTVFHRWDPLPPPVLDFDGPAGGIESQSQSGESYHTTVIAHRPSHLLFRSSFHPGLKAEIDGTIVVPVMVAPGFAAFPIATGRHQVRIFYAAGSLKSILFWLGVAALLLLVRVARAGGLDVAEFWFCDRLGWLGSLLQPAHGTPVQHWISQWRYHRLHLLILLALALVSLRPLYRGLLISGHDSAEYPPRLVEFHENVRNGNPFPIWAPDLANGYGQPLFQFVPPVAYWAAEFFYVFGAGITDSLQFGALALGILSSLSLYFLGVAFGSRGAGILSAAAYLFSPYFHVNLFVRGNFMEAAAMALMPVAAIALWRAVDRGGPRSIALGSFGLALFLLCHNATSLLGLPFLVALTAAFAGPDRVRLVRAAATLFLGPSLAAWFLLPALLEKQYIHIDRLREGYLHYSGHFATIAQLLFSRWGYGLSVPGDDDGMSFMLGPVHLVLAALGMLFAFSSASSPHLLRRVGYACAAATLAGAWIATPLSRTLWSVSPTLQYLEFPWRSLAIPSLGLALLAGLFIVRLPQNPNVRAIALSLSIGALIAFNLSHAAPSGFLTFDDAFYTPAQIARLGMNTTTREEYEPRTVLERPSFRNEFVSAIGCGSGFSAAMVGKTPEERTVALQSLIPCTVRLSIFAYPGWTALLDGRPVATKIEPVSGTILLDLAAGSHNLTVRLDPTPLRLSVRLFSLTTLVILLALATFDVWPQFRKILPDRISVFALSQPVRKGERS